MFITRSCIESKSNLIINKMIIFLIKLMIINVYLYFVPFWVRDQGGQKTQDQTQFLTHVAIIVGIK